MYGSDGVPPPPPSPGGNTAAPGGLAAGGAGGQGPHSHPARLPPSAHGSAMSVPNAKFEVTENDGLHQHRSRKWLWAAIAAAVVAISALALGLGLGLGLKHNGGGESDAGPPPNSTCTGNCSTYNGTGLPVRTPWQIVLSETLTLENQTQTTNNAAASTTSQLVTPNPSSDPNVTLYDLDMFLHQNLTVVRDLRAQGMEVICYFSSGSYEPNRPDSWKFKDSDKGSELDGWPGEYWLDLNSDNVRQIMTARIEIAARMNCSGIDPDNVDGYVRSASLSTDTFTPSFFSFFGWFVGRLVLSLGYKC